MNEIYEMIEHKIRESGYQEDVSGFDIYNELCDFIDEKENGTYLFLSKDHNDHIFEYQVQVMDDNFNLSYIDIKTQEETYHIDFDA